MKRRNLAAGAAALGILLITPSVSPAVGPAAAPEVKRPKVGTPKVTLKASFSEATLTWNKPKITGAKKNAKVYYTVGIYFFDRLTQETTMPYYREIKVFKKRSVTIPVTGGGVCKVSAIVAATVKKPLWSGGAEGKAEVQLSDCAPVEQ